MLQGEERNLRRLIQLLDEFSMASGLHINWDKSVAYWFSPNPAPPWLATFAFPWAQDGALSKLLGTAFGLNLAIQDVDSFLYDKVTKKLRYWVTTKLSLAGRAVIVNSVLMSTLWFFVSIWGGSREVIRKIKGHLRNFLWCRADHRCRMRVRWQDCCAHKNAGGLGLIDAEDALVALASKWVLKSLAPGSSSIQILLRYRIAKFRPAAKGTWPAASQWTMAHKFSATRGSRC
jgi:hypothetical protein